MNFLSEIPSPSFRWEEIQKPKERSIKLQVYSDLCSPEIVVNRLASMEGAIDVYCWYEGSQCLPKSGADFMRKAIFEPLYRLKKDAKLCLYSLKAWELKKNVANMSSSTPLGEAINRINSAAIECVYASSFFQYCTEIQKKSRIYDFLNEELPKKEWLFTLSENQRKKGMTVGEFFNKQISLFDSIKDLDLSAAYSPMQYVEGYYLIQKSVREAVSNGQKKIQIAFVLPNDESKYYLDYPKSIEKMLQLDFGKELLGVDVNISFQFFEYGNNRTARPYIDKRPKAPKVGAEEVHSYFDYLSKPSISGKRFSMPLSRDLIHNINGWY